MLSLCSVTGSTAFGTTSRLISRLLSHTASYATTAAVYSSSTVDNAIISYFLLREEMAPPLRPKHMPILTCIHQGLQPNQHLCSPEDANLNFHNIVCSCRFPLGVTGLF